MQTTYQYDHYYRYEELEAVLHDLQKQYPTLMQLKVNMVTQENRNQYLAILTNQETGSDTSKPAMYLDGNIHAGEVTASMVALYTLDALLTNYASNTRCRFLLDTFTIYIIPRVSVDGAQTYLTKPYHLRSSTIPYNQEEGGLYPLDIDQDGICRMMKIPSASGAWKMVDNKLTLRQPSDIEGDFFDLYLEGNMEEGKEDPNLFAKKIGGLDFNRNFPCAWFNDARQSGAGPYPLSNPECKALVDFVLDHKNIVVAALGHTSGGILLYPPGIQPEAKADSQDMHIYRNIAKMGEEELGYEALNIFDSFVGDQENYDSGAFDDWLYQDQGILAYTMEFWDLAKRVKVPYVWNARKNDPYKDIERFYAMVEWTKTNAPQYYIDFKAFHHDQLGDVEIGGLNTKFTVQNPPEAFLEEVLEKGCAFYLRYMSTLPRVAIENVHVEQKGDDVYCLNLDVVNLGYLATYGTKEALRLKRVHDVEVELCGVDVLDTKVKTIGHLEGFSSARIGSYYGNLINESSAKAKKRVSFWIKKPTDTLVVEIRNEKIGTLRFPLSLTV